MAHFYGSVKGSRGEATRLGGKGAGMRTTAASWSGAIHTRLYVDDDGHDCVRVYETTWNGAGVDREIYRGRVGVAPKKKGK